MIYTSSFERAHDIPFDVVRISICGKAPDAYPCAELTKLAPSYSVYMHWKETGDNDYYTYNYKKDVLDKIDIRELLLELHEISKGKDMVLLTYEDAGHFSHREIVRDWLTENGILSKEFL